MPLQTHGGGPHAGIFRRALRCLLAAPLVFGSGPAPAGGTPGPTGGRAPVVSVDYVADIRSACEQIGRVSRRLIVAKGIDWKRVTRQILKEARAVRTHRAHLALLLRLVARLRDGRADVIKTRHTQEVPYPDQGVVRAGPGMVWCRVGKKIYVKNAWSGAARVGVTPGMQVLRVDGRPAARWLEARLATLRDHVGLSTSQHALGYALSEGLAATVGTRRDFVFRDLRGKVRKRTIVHAHAGFAARGPAFPVGGRELPRAGREGNPHRSRREGGYRGDRDVRLGTLPDRIGYLWLRRMKSSVPYRTEDALRALGPLRGLILDLRGTLGGGFDVEALFGRFLAAGTSIHTGELHMSRGKALYAGPLVVLVDAMTRGRAEVIAGLLKEDGRAYVIGERATAGTSSFTRTLDLPSGLFQVVVSTRTTHARLAGGRGLEGVGVEPHEQLSYDPADLATGRDTLIERAATLLRLATEAWPKHWPSSPLARHVPYDPARFGWKPP